MIITTFSEESTLIAQKTRDLLTTMGQEVVLVPFGVTGMFISIDDDTNQFVVYASDDQHDLDKVFGFDDLEQCWLYARIVVEAAGLTEEDIDADVW